MLSTTETAITGLVCFVPMQTVNSTLHHAVHCKRPLVLFWSLSAYSTWLCPTHTVSWSLAPATPLTAQQVLLRDSATDSIGYHLLESQHSHAQAISKRTPVLRLQPQCSTQGMWCPRHCQHSPTVYSPAVYCPWTGSRAFDALLPCLPAVVLARPWCAAPAVAAAAELGPPCWARACLCSVAVPCLLLLLHHRCCWVWRLQVAWAVLDRDTAASQDALGHKGMMFV